MDESGQSGQKTLRVEGRGCVFGGQVVFGRMLKNWSCDSGFRPLDVVREWPAS